MRLFLKNLLFTLLVPGTVGVLVPWLIARDSSASGPLAILARALAPLPLAGGAGVYFWCLWDFASFGRGTPAPIDAPRRLVVRGLYRYVRNPMYVGVLGVILGWSLYFAAPVLLLYGAAVGLAFHLFILGYEEPTLHRLFGEEYASYCGRVNRWLPRLRRGDP